MDNDSLFFPFEHIGDGLFDADGDGALTGFETAMRDGALFAALEETDGDNDPTSDDDDDWDDGSASGLDVEFETSRTFGVGTPLGKRRAQARRWAEQLETLADMISNEAIDVDADAADAEGDRWDKLNWFSEHLQDAETALRDAAEFLNYAADGWVF